MADRELDPITLQVISGALDTIAEEMGHVLYRMSFSSIIRESQDLGAGLFDTEYNTLCESESTPLHIGSLPGYLEGVEKVVKGDWADGDVVIHNHPYYGSSHSPDIAVVIPIFFKDKLVGYSANTAHHLDIGAATPGLIIDIPDVYAEGMLFAGTKLYEAGRRNEQMWDYIRNNSRASRQLLDDLDAQIASARLGVRRFIELMDRFGYDTVIAATRQLMDYTERVLRQRIAAIPDGEYRAEGFLDDDGRNRDVRLPIKVCVRIRGDGIEVDLTGSADQVETGFNVPFEGSTKVACFCAIRSLLLDAETSEIKVPSNQGSFRPIDVIAPEGSIFNPRFPAAAEARFSQINRVIDLIYKALSPVLPDEIIAGSSATLSFAAYSGVRPSGDYWVFLEVNEGSYGGRPASDGPDSIDSLMANTRNNPLEDLAMHLPMVCDRYELRTDIMPAPGRFRGGLGVVKKQRMLGRRVHHPRGGPARGHPVGGLRGLGRRGRAAPDLQRRAARGRAGHAREVLGAQGRGGRRDGLLRAERRGLRRPARPVGGEGARRRARRVLHRGGGALDLRGGGGSRGGAGRRGGDRGGAARASRAVRRGARGDGGDRARAGCRGRCGPRGCGAERRGPRTRSGASSRPLRPRTGAQFRPFGRAPRHGGALFLGHRAPGPGRRRFRFARWREAGAGRAAGHAAPAPDRGADPADDGDGERRERRGRIERGRAKRHRPLLERPLRRELELRDRRLPPGRRRGGGHRPAPG